MNYSKKRIKEVSEDGIAVFKLAVLDNVIDSIGNENNDRNNIKMIILIRSVILNFK